MTTWSYNLQDLPRYSITEILILPSFPIHKYLIEISTQFDNSIYFDTIGNLLSYKEFYSLETSIVHICSIRKLIRELTKLQNRSDFLLVIDSISFLADKNLQVYLEIYSILLKLILNNKCTVICTNQYRKSDINVFIPRLGGVWSKIVTNRIFYKYVSDKITYEIIRNYNLS